MFPSSFVYVWHQTTFRAPKRATSASFGEAGTGRFPLTERPQRGIRSSGKLIETA